MCPIPSPSSPAVKRLLASPTPPQPLLLAAASDGFGARFRGNSLNGIRHCPIKNESKASCRRQARRLGEEIESFGVGQRDAELRVSRSHCSSGRKRDKRNSRGTAYAPSAHSQAKGFAECWCKQTHKTTETLSGGCLGMRLKANSPSLF